jgi:predicted RNase H-like HicB family nuclease
VLTRDRLPAWNEAYRIEIFLEIDDEGEGGWVARHPELPGCIAQGDTPAQALTSLAEARELYLKGLDNPPLPLVRDYRLDPAHGVEVPFGSPRPAPEPSVA